ncbi:hypothetical protein V7654_12470 [Bacillus sp. JJ1609]|uniref:hypothetical protein n=1 Tax=Bacillus sp. JJ1609 TaxID=3122977 RepID=UPI002FFEBAEA
MWPMKMNIEKVKDNWGKPRELFKVNNKRPYKTDGILTNTIVKESFDFAFDMSFGKKGEHRQTRTGGDSKRTNGEIFTNAFQGKLAEYGTKHFFKEHGVLLDEPDTERYGLGKWDSVDFDYKKKKISVKSTKFYGELLLLETGDWNEKGEYRPNLAAGKPAEYDYFVLVRIMPNIEKIMDDNKLLKKDVVKKEALESIFFNEQLVYSYNLPGCISKKSLLQIIESKTIIPKRAFLNKKGNSMDAENYYVQTGDLIQMSKLINKLKEI